MGRGTWLLLSLVAVGVLDLDHAAAATANATWWQPAAGLKFDYVLAGGFNPSTSLIPGVQVYLVDGFETTAAAVAAIKASGHFPVCYFSAGSHENWRLDQAQFNQADIGKPLQGWEGEHWLNIRSEAVKTIMVKRMEMCKAKGFIAVDPDNVDGYTNDNGFDLTAADQLDFNKWLAATAHGLGMAVGLKNDPGQVAELEPYFDFFVVEECQQEGFCGKYAPAKAVCKPVFNVEYEQAFFQDACACQAAYGITTIFKTLDLNSFRQECPAMPAANAASSTCPGVMPASNVTSNDTATISRCAAKPPAGNVTSNDTVGQGGGAQGGAASAGAEPRVLLAVVAVLLGAFALV